MAEADKDYVVLVIEDDPDHALLVRAAFRRGAPTADVRIVRSAEEAIAYLRGPWVDTRPPTPAVLVLDINMPGIGGLGFLDWYGRQADEVADIPVVVFTSSDEPELARRCYAMGAREFKEKPDDFMELLDVVRRVLARWAPRDRDTGSATA